jgi:hypothetical protein
VNLINRERAAGVVTIPDDYLAGAGFKCTCHRCVNLAGEQTAALFVSPLSGQELLIGIIDAADALHIRHYENLRPLRCADGRGKTKQK